MPYEDYQDALWYDLHTAFADDITKHVTKEPVGRLSDGQPDYLDDVVFSMLDADQTEVQRRGMLSLAVDRLMDSTQQEYEQALSDWDVFVDRGWRAYQAHLRAEEEAKKKQ